jgi:hypothetical protein
MAPKRAFAPGANDDEAGSSRRIPPALRAAGHCGGLYIGDAGRVTATLTQPAVPKPEEDDNPDMCAALALSIAEEEAKWPQLVAVIRIYAMEEEARQVVEDAEAWALLGQGRREEEARHWRDEARLRQEEARRQAELLALPQGGGTRSCSGAAGGQPSGPHSA